MIDSHVKFMKAAMLLLAVYAFGSRDSYSDAILRANAKVIREAINLYKLDHPEIQDLEIRELTPEYLHRSFSFHDAIALEKIRIIRKLCYYTILLIFIVFLLSRKRAILYLMGFMLIFLFVTILAGQIYRPSYDYLNDYEYSDNLLNGSEGGIRFYEKPELRPNVELKIILIRGQDLERMSLHDINNMIKKEF